MIKDSLIAAGDACLKTFVNSICELPGIELSVLRVATRTWLMIRVTLPARAIPITEHVLYLDTVSLDRPWFLYFTTASSTQPESASMKIHRRQAELKKHGLHRRFCPQ